MISRTTIGRSFGGVVRYQFEGRKEQPSDKQAEVLAAVGVRADSAAHMSADFNRGRQLNPNLGQAVWHTSLSFNPDDAAKLDSAKMLAIAEGYVQKMGLDKTQYAIIRHHDQPDNQHLHIIANRVADDGQTIKDGQNFFRSKQALRELIQEHGLTPPHGLRPEKQHSMQLQGAELTKHEIKEALHQALATATDRPALLTTLQAQQISAREFANKAGEVTGISFEKDGAVFKGSQLGRGYGLAGITQQLAANQVAQQAAQEQAARQRQAAAAQLAQQQEAERQAAQQREATRRAAEVAKGPELPAVERKWQAAYQAQLAKLARQNAPIQAHNKIIDSYSQHLKAHPTEEGVATVVKAMKGDPRTAALRTELERQLAAQAAHAAHRAATHEQRATLEKQAKGGFFGQNATSRAAAEKLKFLNEPDRPLPDLLQPELLEFARAAKVAARPAPPIGFEARTYYQPEAVGPTLATYAAQREAERQVVVRMSQSADEARTGGRAEALQRTLDSQGAKTQLTHRLDAQGNRVSELVVQYSLQSRELQKVSRTLDWAQGREGYEVQEQAADRAQRRAPGQQDAQREQARTPSKGQGLGR
jgi:hypothetical protein